MKKFSIVLVAAIMVLALTMPAAAFENEFGGYWRTRAFSNWGFTGASYAGPKAIGNSSAQDIEAIDTRTRLYYTAKFSDNLKFVNKFEMNAGWGSQLTYGQLAADGANFVVKASYVDFKLAEQRFTVGIQDFTLARGYLFDDDAAGIKAIFKVNDAVYLPLIYMKLYEGGQGWSNSSNLNPFTPNTYTGTLTNSDNFDVDAYVFYPSIFLNKDNVLKPHVAYLTSENYNRFATKTLTNSMLNPFQALQPTNVGLWTAGLEYDGKFDIWTVGATGIFEFGGMDLDVDAPANVNRKDTVNFKGYLFDLRGGVDLGPANIHMKGIYASGDGKNDVLRTGDEWGFIVPGVSNAVGGNVTGFNQANWSEIMGAGMFDYQFPNGALGPQIKNAIIGGIGGSYKLLQDLQFSMDLWYARAADSITTYYNLDGTPQYTDTYGTELDLKLTYTIVDNLKIDLVGAYLWAGDAITKSTWNPNLGTLAANAAAGVAPTTTYQPAGTNPIEIGAQLSLAF
jgi:hypothetical protein